MLYFFLNIYTYTCISISIYTYYGSGAHEVELGAVVEHGVLLGVLRLVLRRQRRRFLRARRRTLGTMLGVKAEQELQVTSLHQRFFSFWF